MAFVSRTCRSLVAVAIVFAALAFAADAHAQNALHPSSDAIYVGLRAEPGVAYLVAYDFDLLVSDSSTGISIGPSVSFSVGGDSSTDLGRRQDWLLSADLLRARLSFVREHGFRAMVLLGAGLYVVGLPEQTSDPHLALDEDGQEILVSDRWAAMIMPGALVTGGLGADWYWDAHWGVAAFFVGHVRLDDQNRMPALWIEAGVGLRWGE